MIRVTLDTNFLYACEDHRSNSSIHSDILELGHTSDVKLQISAIMAAENQRPGNEISNFSEFLKRVNNAGMGHAEILKPMGMIGLAFVDYALCVDEEMIETEEEIHRILFPKVPINAIDSNEAELKKWYNAKCDVQMMWCHLFYNGNIFVTRDKVFHKATKKPRLEGMGAGTILKPEEAWEFLKAEIG